MGGMSDVSNRSSEKPRPPSAVLVLMRPIARTARVSLNVSSRPPEYSPFSASNLRKPPPVKPPASMASPAPSGGLNPSDRFEGPGVARLETHVGGEADAHQDELHGANLPGDSGGDLQRDRRRICVRLESDRGFVHSNRAQMQVRVQGHLEGRAALEPQPAAGSPLDAEWHVDGHRRVADEVAEEVVAFARGDHQLEAVRDRRSLRARRESPKRRRPDRP